MASPAKLLGVLFYLVCISLSAAISNVATRSVVDHVVCFTLNDLIPEEEEATLKAGWDLQFTCEPDISILSLSTGRLLNQNNRINCSHALFVRYPTWEDVGEYWNHPCKTTFAQAFIHRQLNGEVDVDIGGVVPDTLEAVTRTGKKFEGGVDHFVQLKIEDSASSADIEEILLQFDALAEELGPTVVVQQTRGFNRFPSSLERGIHPHFTLGVAARLTSVEAVDAYYSHPIYTSILAKSIDSMTYSYPPYEPHVSRTMEM